VLTRLWEAFKRWDWGRRVLLLIGAPWLALLAWMAATGKPRLMTSAAVSVTALLWLGFALAPFANNTEHTNATGGATPTTEKKEPMNATGGTTTAITADVSTTFTTAKRATPTPAPPPTATATGPVRLPVGEETTVVRVVDGDTIEVAGGERVRLIGIDTPEVYGGAECYGEQASAYTKQLLPAGTPVRLVHDVERLDRYGRTLAYVYRMVDGEFINASLVRNGYAQVATYPPNVAHVEEFLELQRQARQAGAGLWSACSDAAAGDIDPAPPAAEPSPAPAPSGNCNSAYPDACIASPPPDLDCGEIAHRRFRVLPPDPHGFDGADNDGVGCESG
jgi:micrococcal nuclease